MPRSFNGVCYCGSEADRRHPRTSSRHAAPAILRQTGLINAAPAPAPRFCSHSSSSAAARHSSDGPEPRVGSPECFTGDPVTCGAFLTNCFLLFSLQPRTFATEAAKVAYEITHLTGQAQLWGREEWKRQTLACSSFQVFAEELRKVFG